MKSWNIAATLKQIAESAPETPAIIVPWQNRKISFGKLHTESSRLASGLSRLGIAKSDRVLILVPFGIDFILLTYALFKTGAVPVLIDPGLGRKNMLQCIEQAEPRGMIALSLAHAARIFFPKPFRTIEVSVTVGRRWFWGGKTLRQVRQSATADFEPAYTYENDPAAILFTSGSTGPAKGVLYTHGMFTHQVEILKSCFRLAPGQTDLPTFPLFGLFNASLGITCVLPEMDCTRPSQVDPEKIIGPIQKYQITNSFGSPALWDTVSRYCLEKNIRLPSLKRILMAGAPVPGPLLKRFDRILDARAEIFTPYGATEALPVTSIDREEILAETWDKTEQGFGICVGRPVPGLRLKIIKITDDPIPFWDARLEPPRGEVGEVVVQGNWVTQKYFNRDDADRLAKIVSGDTFWHRMGDLGWLDSQGRLWFCGRKSHRVTTKNQTLFTIPSEAIFNRHPKVKRSALVGLGQKPLQEPVIIVELEDKSLKLSARDRETLVKELLDSGSGYSHTKEIKHVLIHPEFPVDIRHNAKIFREKLAPWAEKEVSK